MNHGAWFGGMAWIMWLVAVIIPLTLAMGVYALIMHGRRQGDTPLDVIKKRYARGELTRDQFEQLKQDLNKS